jgi:GMP synthase-like glutamine amidotransferase
MLDIADNAAAAQQQNMHDDSASSVHVLTKMFGDPVTSGAEDTHTRTLSFIMLGCEPNPPYGPNQHTAELLLDSIGQAALESTSSILWTISIHIYDVQKGEYPDNDDWNSFDGVLLPGSFASAYDGTTAAWIETLARVIQQEIVAAQRPTLGICFGHQLLAHSFPSGCAVKTPTGPCGGRFAMTMTKAGSDLLKWSSNDSDNNESIDGLSLYYTHGDMVSQLPNVAVSLGGNEQVPIQAAAYFATPDEAARVAAGNSSSSSCEQQPLPKPYAVTFQAHPEYASSRSLGMHQTFDQVLDSMERRGDLKGRLSAGQDAQEHFETVQKHSVHVMLSAGRSLGWFP